MTPLRPFHDHVLVKIEPKPERTRGGLIIAGTTPHPVRVGTVLRLGQGRKYRDRFLGMDVKLGERVVFLIGSVDTKSGQAISHHLSEDEVLIREPDILFAIPDDSTLEVTL